MPRKLTIVHDYLTQPGGAERVVAELFARWPDAEVRTLLYDPDGTFPVFKDHNVVASTLQPLARRVSPRILFPVLPAAMRSLAVEDADIVLSSSSGWAHGVRVAPGIPHICYCHNPARWIYQTDAYLPDTTARIVLRPMLGALRRWDQVAARRPTRYVANSENVRQRIAQVYGRPAEVVHPPVRPPGVRAAPLPDDGYLLVFGRLLRYKRVDLAIEAARLADVPIVIAGDGPDRQRLHVLAARQSHVEMLGRVPDESLPALFTGARALFLGGEEDFGITALEANAAGRPVVAFAKGGALETVVDDVTGIHFTQQTADAAAAGIRKAWSRSWDRQSLAGHSDQWRPERFLDRLEEIMERALRRS